MRDFFIYKCTNFRTYLYLYKQQANFSTLNINNIKTENQRYSLHPYTTSMHKENYSMKHLYRSINHNLKNFNLSQELPQERKGLIISENMRMYSGTNKTSFNSAKLNSIKEENKTNLDKILSEITINQINKNKSSMELSKAVNNLSTEQVNTSHISRFDKEISQYVSEEEDLNKDKFLFYNLNEKRQYLKNKYSFNEYSSSTHIRSYNFNRGIKKINITSLYKILKSFFISFSTLISKPKLEISPDKIRIRLFYYILPSIKKMKNTKILLKNIKLDETIRKEKIKRQNFKLIMNKFKMNLFIAKWKEENDIIRMVAPLSKWLCLNLKILKFKIDTQDQVPCFDRINGISLEEMNQFSSREKYYTTKKNLLKDITNVEDKIHKNKQIEEVFTSRNLRDEKKEKSSLFDLRKEATLISLNKLKFKYLLFILEKLLKKTIILEVVRLKYPYHESNILAQILGFSSKNKSFRLLMKKLLYTAIVKNPSKMIRKQNFTIIPSYLSGLKVRLAGRLRTQKVVPRFTVQSFQIGSLGRGKTNFTISSRVTLKNKRGAFSFTVSTSHIFDK